MSTLSSHVVHDVLFDFFTPLACIPSPVDCQITGMLVVLVVHYVGTHVSGCLTSSFFKDSHGNEYDLSHLIRNGDDAPWVAVDTDGVKARQFYINVCKPLPNLENCPGQCTTHTHTHTALLKGVFVVKLVLATAVGPLGACGLINGKGYNLGYVQSSPQMLEDGSISIVYQNGDQCDSTSFYSTRIIFQCYDHPVSSTAIDIGRGEPSTCSLWSGGPNRRNPWLTSCVRLQGSPVFDRKDGCEYVFIWRTSEACPVKKSQGEHLENDWCLNHFKTQ